MTGRSSVAYRSASSSSWPIVTTDDAGIYEIVSYCRLKDKSLCYDVQFNDCDDTITLDEEELWNMLVYSLYIPA
jgi:hypothetical protein